MAAKLAQEVLPGARGTGRREGTAAARAGMRRTRRQRRPGTQARGERVTQILSSTAALTGQMWFRCKHGWAQGEAAASLAAWGREGLGRGEHTLSRYGSGDSRPPQRQRLSQLSPAANGAAHLQIKSTCAQVGSAAVRLAAVLPE